MITLTKHACDRRTDRQTDRWTDGQNYDPQDRASIAALQSKMKTTVSIAGILPRSRVAKLFDHSSYVPGFYNLSQNDQDLVTFEWFVIVKSHPLMS